MISSKNIPPKIGMIIQAREEIGQFPVLKIIGKIEANTFNCIVIESNNTPWNTGDTWNMHDYSWDAGNYKIINYYLFKDDNKEVNPIVSRLLLIEL